jgi:leucyl/phenylalanyl-tRNA--protein transferase
MPSDIFFPPVTEADEDGVVTWSNVITPAWLLAGYRQGIFAWPCDIDDDVPVPWFSTDPRAIFEIDQFHVSRRLRQTIASGKFRVTVNHDFAGVLQGCVDRRAQDGTSWLTPALRAALLELHHSGEAHSVECWYEGRLAGGVYGVAIGGYFSAESMFFRVRDASKVALAALVDRLRGREFALLDIQVLTKHTQSLGAIEISRGEFQTRLAQAIALPRSFISSTYSSELNAQVVVG